MFFYITTLLCAMFSLMFFGFLRVDEVMAIPHNLSVPWCRIKPCKLRLAFWSHKYSVDFPFNLDFLPTERTPCPCRRMVNYIKLGGGGTWADNSFLLRQQVTSPKKVPRSSRRSHRLGREEHLATLLSYRCCHMAAKSGFSSEQIKAMGHWHSDCYRKYIQVESIPSKTSTGHT